ncbi:hypothetical protein TYRP_015945, partial [Tyrophagus putrescentiae]
MANHQRRAWIRSVSTTRTQLKLHWKCMAGFSGETSRRKCCSQNSMDIPGAYLQVRDSLEQLLKLFRMRLYWVEKAQWWPRSCCFLKMRTLRQKEKKERPQRQK